MATYQVISSTQGLITFNTSLSEAQAVTVLREELAVKFNEFQDSLVRGFSLPGGLSDRQSTWLLKEAQDILDERRAQIEGGPYSPLLEPFKMSGLKKLKIRYGDLTLAQAGEYSSNPGGLWVNWRGDFCGRITKGGLARLRSNDERLLERLNEANADPITTAIKYGKETGHCAICNAKLDDPISVFGSIGPVCLSRIAGPGARKAMERAFKEGNPQTLFDALKALKAKRDGAQEPAPQAPPVEVRQEDYQTEEDYQLAKALAAF